MSFDSSLNDAYTSGFDPGIRAAGYRPLRIDGKEHINGISDEIIAEIRRSRFIVADYTLTNNGVYFEAGVAVGLGIPVIGTCRADFLNKLHFDIRHINTIRWESVDQLARDLSKRISGVLGDGPLLDSVTNVQRFSLGGAAHRPSVRSSAAGIRAGERKTCWAKPLPPATRAMGIECRRILCRCAIGTFRAAVGSRSRLPTESSSDHRQPGSDRSAAVLTQPLAVRGPSIPTPIWRVVRLDAVRPPIPGHDVSGTGWQMVGRAMQSITTMMPVWQCGHSRNDCPVSTSKRSR